MAPFPSSNRLTVVPLLASFAILLAMPASAELTEADQAELRARELELENRKASLGLAKAKLEAIQEKLKAQEAFIGNLNDAITGKGRTMPAEEEIAVEDDGSLPAGFLTEVTPRIVVIEGDKGNGTGFLCRTDGELWVYTAAHVLSGNSKVTVRDSGGKLYRDFEFIEAADGVDLVRLKLVAGDHRGLELATGTDAPDVGDTIVAIGNSLGTGSLSGEPGRILSITEDMWEVDAEIIPGNSGGPVLSLESGKVVGIVTHLIISKQRSRLKPDTETQVKRFAARLDRKWEWRKLPVARFVKEWRHIETMNRDSSIAWASIYLMHAGAQTHANRNPSYRSSYVPDPKLVAMAESVLAENGNHFHVQRMNAWLKRFRESGPTQQNMVIGEGNKVIDRILEDIRLKDDGPKEDDFSWFHREMFKEELEWRKKLTDTAD